MDTDLPKGDHKMAPLRYGNLEGFFSKEST